MEWVSLNCNSCEWKVTKVDKKSLEGQIWYSHNGFMLVHWVLNKHSNIVSVFQILPLDVH